MRNFTPPSHAPYAPLCAHQAPSPEGVDEAVSSERSCSPFPIELLEFHHLGGLGIGGGVTYELAPSLKGSGFASAIDYRFSHPCGAVAQVEYTLSLKKAGTLRVSGWQVGARYGLMRFSSDNDQAFTGHTVGGVFSVLF